MKTMKFYFAIVFCVTLQICQAQEEKSTLLPDQTKVVYSVNASKKLEGPYSVTDADKILLRGVYKDNERTGNWYAFNNDGKMFLRYNYDLKKLVFIDTTSVSRINIEVNSNDKNVQEKATIPFPIMSIDQYISLLGSEFKRMVLIENKNADGRLDVDLVTNVDENGKASYKAVYDVNGVKAAKILKISQKGFDVQWFPATYEGKNLPSTFTVSARIDLSSRYAGKQRFAWVY